MARTIDNYLWISRIRRRRARSSNAGSPPSRSSQTSSRTAGSPVRHWGVACWTDRWQLRLDREARALVHDASRVRFSLGCPQARNKYAVELSNEVEW